MYTRYERENILEQLKSFFNSIEAIKGAVLLGSGTIGFTDDFSDLDFMIAVKGDEDCIKVKNLILKKIHDLGYSFGKIVEFRKNRFIIVAILDNFLELDISVVPIDELVTRSEQWEILFDSNNEVYNKMSDNWNNRTKHSVLETIKNNNLIVETTYLLRRSLIELARGNMIYAANLTNEIREYILIIECLIEGKKVHQFKNYSSLNEDFKVKLTKTYVGNLNKIDILKAIIHCKKLFFDLINNISDDKEYSKYEEILSTYINELF